MTVLVGPILPTLQSRWSLQDVQAGYFFTAQFVASFSGAAISLIHPGRSLSWGFACVASGALLLSVLHYPSDLAAIALIGFGLGLAINATNLLVAQSSLNRKGASLAFLNACWGLGAVFAPQFVSLSLAHASLQGLLLGLAAASLIILALLQIYRPASTPNTARGDSRKHDLRLFLLFALLLFSYVGAENCISGWIASYAARVTGLAPVVCEMLISLFWISLVCGRFLLAWLLRFVPEIPSQIGGLFAALAGCVLLFFGRTPAAFIAGSSLCGLGMSPVFPVTAGVFYSRIRSTRQAGWVFAISGLGGAAFPWMVGFLSTRSGSLRTGFAVPVAAITLVLALTFVIPGRQTSV